MNLITIREWAELCTDDTIRKQWIKNAEECDWNSWHNNNMYTNMSDALFDSFDWGASPQGHFYWREIRCDMRDNPNKYLKKKKVMFHEYAE